MDPLSRNMIIEIILSVLFPTLWFSLLSIYHYYYSFFGIFSFITLSIFYIILGVPSSIFVRVFLEEVAKCFFATSWKEGAAAGIGFSLMENIVWALQSNPMTLLLRGIFTTGIHALSSGLIGTRKPSLVLIGYLIHVNWNLLVRSI